MLLRERVLDPGLKYPEHGKVSKYYGFGPEHDPAKGISDWLLPKLEQLIGPHKIAFMAYQEAIQPWHIHADIRWDEKEVPYKVLLMPLDVEPVTGAVDHDQWIDTYTIAFHQRNFLRALPEKGDEYIKPNTGMGHWPRPADDPGVEGLIEGYDIDQNTWNKYFSNLDYSYAQGLTIDKVNKWVPRSVMYWDNTALHAADNFLANGIRTKRSFMVFTYL